MPFLCKPEHVIDHQVSNAITALPRLSTPDATMFPRQYSAASWGSNATMVCLTLAVPLLTMRIAQMHIEILCHAAVCRIIFLSCRTRVSTSD